MALYDAGPLEVLTKDAAWVSAPARCIYQPFSGSVLVKTRPGTFASEDSPVGAHFAPLLVSGSFDSFLAVEAYRGPGHHTLGLQLRRTSDTWVAVVLALEPRTSDTFIVLCTCISGKLVTRRCGLVELPNEDAAVEAEMNVQWNPTSGSAAFSLQLHMQTEPAYHFSIDIDPVSLG